MKFTFLFWRAFKSFASKSKIFWCWSRCWSCCCRWMWSNCCWSFLFKNQKVYTILFILAFVWNIIIDRIIVQNFNLICVFSYKFWFELPFGFVINYFTNSSHYLFRFVNRLNILLFYYFRDLVVVHITMFLTPSAESDWAEYSPAERAICPVC